MKSNLILFVFFAFTGWLTTSALVSLDQPMNHNRQQLSTIQAQQ